MIGSISSVQGQSNLIQALQSKNETNQVQQNLEALKDRNKITSENNKASVNSLSTDNTNAAGSSNPKVDIMDQLSQIEAQYFSTNTDYSKTNTQANRITGLQTYAQVGKSEFAFA